MVFALSTIQAAVVYNSLSSASSAIGAVWPNGFVGDAITLTADSAVLDGLKIRARPFVVGSSTFTAFFYNLDAGDDGVFQTGDDKIGSLLGSSSGQSSTFTTSSSLTTVSLSGFSIVVPKNFIWAVQFTTRDLMVATLSDYSSVTGGTSSLSTGLWYQTGSPSPGGNLLFNGTSGNHTFGQDWAVELSGVPEPSAASLLVLGAGVLAVIRRRKKD